MLSQFGLNAFKFKTTQEMFAETFAKPTSSPKETTHEQKTHTVEK